MNNRLAPTDKPLPASVRRPIAGQGATATEMVRVLLEDPDLGRHLTPGAFPLASSAAVAPLLAFPKATKNSLVPQPEEHGHLGLLVLDGLIARHVSFEQIGATEFLGTGDVLRPWRTADGSAIFSGMRWEILTPTRLAVLDREFANRIRPWPELIAALLDRATDRINSQLLQAALRQARRVEDRVVLALWHFAGRWGQVAPEGRIVKLPITGEVLANVVGARRQSVSSALTSLSQSGAIHRRPDGSWLLYSRAPQLHHIQPGERASDVVPGTLAR